MIIIRYQTGGTIHAEFSKEIAEDQFLDPHAQEYVKENQKVERNLATTLENNLAASSLVRYKFTIASAIPVLGIHQEKLKHMSMQRLAHKC